jgi:hypothetical protein
LRFSFSPHACIHCFFAAIAHACFKIGKFCMEIRLLLVVSCLLSVSARHGAVGEDDGASQPQHCLAAVGRDARALPAGLLASLSAAPVSAVLGLPAHALGGRLGVDCLHEADGAAGGAGRSRCICPR